MTTDEFLKNQLLTGGARPLILETLKQRVAAEKARELGMEVSDEELQSFADAFRAANGLHSAEETYAFFSGNGLSDEDFERFCEETVLSGRLRDHLGTEAKIQEYFINNRARFDRALVSSIVVARQELAQEILLQLEEEEVEFAQAAAKHSLDQAGRYAGGRVGLIGRQALPPEVSAKVFNASPGEVLGPFEMGGTFHLFRVHEVRRAELDRELQEQIKDDILEEWARRRIGDAVSIGD
jgi:peptidylprolyl isomerase